MEILPEIVNAFTKVVGLFSVLYSVVVWILIFFKRHSMLKAISGMNDIFDTTMCSLLIFTIGGMIFGMTYIGNEDFNGYSLGTVVFGLVICMVILLFALDKIGNWRKSFNEI